MDVPPTVVSRSVQEVHRRWLWKASDVRVGPDGLAGLNEPSIEIIKEAPFLSEEQKRDIFYNNAARFLRLSEEEITRHHGR